MASNFDNNFETHKVSFKQKFGKDWNADHHLYLTYLNTLYLSRIADIANNGLGQILSKQEELHKLLQSMSQKIK